MTTPVSDYQLAHWRAIRPRRAAFQKFKKKWIKECGCNPTSADIGRAFGLTSATVYAIMAYTPVTQRKKKSPTNHYASHTKEVPRRPPNARRLAQAIALLG